MSEHTPEMLELVSVFALGGIDATSGECVGIREHIAQCAICQAEFRRSSAASAVVGLSASETPPAELRAKVFASLPSSVRTLPRRRAWWYLPAAAAAAVLIAIGVSWKTQLERKTWLASCAPAIPSCHASGVLRAIGGNLELQLHGLAALPAGEQYQAWMIPPGKAPAPEPVFSATQSGDGSVSFAGTPTKGAMVAVTVEPMGGSRQPTTKPFLIARID